MKPVERLRTRIAALMGPGTQTRTILIMYGLSAGVLLAFLPALAQEGYQIDGSALERIGAAAALTLIIGIGVDLAARLRRDE